MRPEGTAGWSTIRGGADSSVSGIRCRKEGLDEEETGSFFRGERYDGGELRERWGGELCKGKGAVDVSF